MANFAPKIVSVFSPISEPQMEKTRSIFFDRMLKFRRLDIPEALQAFPVQNVYIKRATNPLAMRARPARPLLAPVE